MTRKVHFLSRLGDQGFSTTIRQGIRCGLACSSGVRARPNPRPTTSCGIAVQADSRLVGDASELELQKIPAVFLDS